MALDPVDAFNLGTLVVSIAYGAEQRNVPSLNLHLTNLIDLLKRNSIIPAPDGVIQSLINRIKEGDWDRATGLAVVELPFIIRPLLGKSEKPYLLGERLANTRGL